MGNFSPPSCSYQGTWEGPPRRPSPKPNTEAPLFPSLEKLLQVAGRNRGK